MARAKGAQWDKPVPLFHHHEDCKCRSPKYTGGGHSPLVFCFVCCPCRLQTLCVYCTYFSILASANLYILYKVFFIRAHLCVVHIIVYILLENKHLGGPGTQWSTLTSTPGGFLQVNFEQDCVGFGDPWSTFNPLIEGFLSCDMPSGLFLS